MYAGDGQPSVPPERLLLGWVSDEHFTVDGTLIESWASMKSFRKKGEPPPPPGERNEWVDFKGEKRSNKTHCSSTDPDARLMRKGPGQEATLTFGLRAAMENRHGLLVTLKLTKACGTDNTESAVALDQMQELSMRGFAPSTVKADKAYHNSEFVEGCHEMRIAPHVARMKGRTVAGIDGRTIRHESYRTSQRIRKRIEEPCGWMKTVGDFRKSRFVGIARIELRRPACRRFLQPRPDGKTGNSRSTGFRRGLRAAGLRHAWKTKKGENGHTETISKAETQRTRQVGRQIWPLRQLMHQ